MSAATLPVVQGPAVDIIHDNPEWIPPVEETFAVCEVPSGAEATHGAEPEAVAEAGRDPVAKQIVRFRAERLRA